jgi:hypothetical protein
MIPMSPDDEETPEVLISSFFILLCPRAGMFGEI